MIEEKELKITLLHQQIKQVEDDLEVVVSSENPAKVLRETIDWLEQKLRKLEDR